MFHWHGSVFDKGDGFVVSLDTHQQSQPHLAHLPYVGLQLGADRRHHPGAPHLFFFEVGFQPLDLGLQFGLALAVELGDQDTVRLALNEGGQ